MDASAAVYDAVCAAVTQDPTRVKSATESLQKLESELGAFNVLYSIAAQRTLPLDVRKLAVIRMKNGGVSSWRRRSAFTPELKTEVRNRSVTFLDEPDDAIARYNSLIVAKIARMDFPNQWPDLIDGLLSVLATNLELYFSSPSPPPQSGLVLRRVLDMLNQVIKELVGKRTPDGSRIMAQLTTSLVPTLNVFNERYTSRVIESLNLNTLQVPEMTEAIIITHLNFKCLSKLMVWLWSKVQQKDFAEGEPMVLNFFKSTITVVQPFHELRLNLAKAIRSGSIPLSAVKSTLDIFTRHVRQYGQVFRKMAVGNTSKFVSIPGSIDLVLFYWRIVLQAANEDPSLTSDDVSALYPVQYIVQALALMKDTLPQWSPTKKDISPDKVLSPDFVQTAIQLLLTRFIPLAPGDLEKWALDSEEWTNEESVESGAWEYDLRPCAERVLIVLSARYTDFVLPFIQARFTEVAQNALSTDLSVILQEEAVYCAIGHTIHHVKDKVDLESWVRRTAVAQVQSMNPDHRVLKRRIAWLIGRWMSSCTPRLKSPHVWQVLAHLLSDRGEASDLAVRLMAASALQECVDALEFNLEVFKPYLSGFLLGLLNLISEAETATSKRTVAIVISSVVAMAGVEIVPLLPTIIAALPQLWGGTHEDSTFRITLLALVTSLVNASREQSNLLVHVVVPLVRESLTPPLSTSLDQDALVLWLAALRHTSRIEPPPGGTVGLIDLFPLAVKLLGENFDLLGSLISIVRSYVLIDCSRVLQVCGVELGNAVRVLLPQALSTNSKDAVCTLNIVVQTAPSNLWAQVMHQSGLFAYLLLELINEKTKVAVTTLVEHVLLFARMMLCDIAVFIQLMNATAGPEFSRQETRLYEGLLDQVWNKFDSMAQPQPRKLLAMGLASFVASGRPEVLSRLVTEIFNVWLDVMGEMKEALEPENQDNPLTIYWKKSETDIVIDADVEGTAEEIRVQQLAARDPVFTQQLTMFVAAQLAKAETAVGGQAVLQAQYLSKGDSITIAAMQKALQEGMNKF